MPRDHLVLGRQGENEAVRFLKKNGHRILARNYTCPLGELDIVTLHDHVIAFVEVKTRLGVNSQPEEAVDHAKRRKLTQVARYFIKKKHLEEFACQFDVVAVHFDTERQPQVDHFPDAFSAIG